MRLLGPEPSALTWLSYTPVSGAADVLRVEAPPSRRDWEGQEGTQRGELGSHEPKYYNPPLPAPVGIVELVPAARKANPKA